MTLILQLRGKKKRNEVYLYTHSCWSQRRCGLVEFSQVVHNDLSQVFCVCFISVDEKTCLELSLVFALDPTDVKLSVSEEPSAQVREEPSYILYITQFSLWDHIIKYLPSFFLRCQKAHRYVALLVLQRTVRHIAEIHIQGSLWWDLEAEKSWKCCLVSFIYCGMLY